MQKTVKNGEKWDDLFKTSKKILFSTLMANIMFIFLEIIWTMEKIQLRCFQIKIAISRVYANFQLRRRPAVERSW